MKLFISSALLLILFSQPIPSGLLEDRVDLTGTWGGLLYVPEIDIDMEITLVLTEKGGVIAGHMTDDWGFLDCDISEVFLKDNIITFKAMVETSRDEHQMAFRMKIAGEEMTGQWESLGSFGDWTLARISDRTNSPPKSYGEKDILGAWTGPAAYKVNPSSKNILTLKLEEREGELVGTFSDQFGTEYKRVNIKSFQDSRLELEVLFVWQNDLVIMEIEATIKDNAHFRGKFRIEKMGRTGVWTAEKQPSK